MPSKKYGLTLFIFRRDLRLHDNTGLIKACRESETVIPAFLFHKDLTDPKGIKFRPNLIQFMLESLRELNNSLSERGSELYIFYNDDYYHGLEKILTEYKIDAVFVNEDYTPYSGKRDNKIKEICIKNNIKFINCFDLLLTRPGDVLTGDGKPYKVFSSFFNKAKKISVEKPLKSLHRNFYHSRIRGRKPMDFLSGILNTINKDIAQRGGRKAAVKVLRKISDFKDYDRKRDFPSLAGTTMLSAHMKFGTVSAREFYWSVRNGLGIKSSLITELFWRDFYAHLSFFFPHVFGQSFNKKYQDIKWLNSKTMFQSWCEGMTGVPIVDAGMRQLNKTGWMHNRVRMIVASFLCKDLHIDWRWGEKYFASKLVDYDPCSNNGGWQWSASTGADSQPYFRIFNPWRQQKRFDPDAVYIKMWVPELRELSPNEIHNFDQGDGSYAPNYPKPIVNHRKEAEKSKDMYRSV